MSKEPFHKTYIKGKELCFDENEFLKDSFSVDTFLREHRNKASLEIMRDDLGTHLKTLRMSMIELINKDYEDFVNLSKDLVGLDNEIMKIQSPLEDIRNEVMGVKNDLEETISGINNCLERHKEITDKKRSLIHLTQVITCLEKLKSIIDSSDTSQNDFSLDLIERATMEFNQLQFSVSKCEKDLVESKRKEVEVINNKLMDILNNKFLGCLKSKNSTELIKCLRIYAGLDKIHNVESLVRQKVVAPLLDGLISEVTLQREPDGVSYIYGEIIKFIESELMVLLNLTTHKETPPIVKGYNFLINSLWPELEKRLDLPLMFAPGNPKLFHSRFTKSVELITKLENLCGNQSSVLKLREHEQYQHFLKKWNLPVYFKIRFQEIAGILEKVLDETNAAQCLQDGVPYSLKSSAAVVCQLKKCWEDEIFLSELSHMFWKLSLQILSRYTIWIGQVLVREAQLQEERKLDLMVERTVQNPSGMDSFNVRTRLDFLVCLYSDTNKLLEESGSFLEMCKDKIPNRELIEEELSVSLMECLRLVGDVLSKITDVLVKVIVSESAVHFRQVSQIPRLFRRTNRKSSTEPCEYVGQALSLPRQFYEWKKNSVSEEVMGKWLVLIFNELTQQFFHAVIEVLTNAQKTEESLRRLMKKKENYSSKNSGDDEIRQQLVIDVHSYCDGVEGIRVKKEDVRSLMELVNTVETARDNSKKQ